MHDLEEKLYQLIIPRLNGYELSSPSYRQGLLELVRKGIGGFIVFGGRKDELKNTLEMLQRESKKGLIIASDIERGAGQQIEGATRFPPQMAVAAALRKDRPEDVGLLARMINAVAAEAHESGINMPLIPVLDVNQNPLNPIICTRAFSDIPEEVVWYGREYIHILEESGLISCAKHFPGHGDTSADSHIRLPVISKSLEELLNTDILPFREIIHSGVSSIMIGHLSVPALDSLPSSLSEKVISGLLRKELGYEGLVLTDALNMHALNSYDNVPVLCMNAGVDILLHPEDPDAVVRQLLRAVQSGDLDEEKIDCAGARIENCKSGIRNHRESRVDMENHEMLSSQIFDKSITYVKGSAEPILNGEIKNVSLVYTADDNEFDLSCLRNNFSDCFSIERAASGEVQIHDTVIFAVFTSIAAWKGSSGIHQEQVAFILESIKKAEKSVVISFGSPYVLRHFNEAGTLIAAYDSGTEAQASAVRSLKGEYRNSGSLPVSISFS